MNFINNSVTVINYNIYNDIYNILEIKLKNAHGHLCKLAFYHDYSNSYQKKSKLIVLYINN
jgi:hypothetical protein